jgi:LuxR family maltose regulon positive regulatory protein
MSNDDLSQPAAAPPLIRMKFRAPPTRKTYVVRTHVLDQVQCSEQARCIFVHAPAGYGKTTFLAQWAERNQQCAVAWVSLDSRDNDPVQFWRYVVEAISGVEPNLGDVSARLEGPAPDLAGDIIPRLVDHLATTSPLALVLDDYHKIQNPKCHETLRAFVDQRPSQVTLAIGSRTEPPLDVARLRARQDVVEITTSDLAFDQEQSAAALRGYGVELSNEEATRLADRVEGWPVGLYLGALLIRDSVDPTRTLADLSGTSRYLGDYLLEEVLARLSKEQQDFLLQTSILERLSPALCDAVTGRTDSHRLLSELSRSNALLFQIDPNDEWYRYHDLFAELLASHLEAEQPETMPALHSRAAEWHIVQGQPSPAIRHALAAGDRKTAADQVSRYLNFYAQTGRLHTAEGWLAEFSEQEIASYLPLAATAALTMVATGDDAGARRYTKYVRALADTADLSLPASDGASSLESTVAMVLCHVGTEGAHQMLADCTRAVQLEPASSVWGPVALIGLAKAALFIGEKQRARRYFEDVTGSGLEQAVVVADGHSFWAALAFTEGDWDTVLSSSAAGQTIVEEAHLEGTVTACTINVVTALGLASSGELQSAESTIKRTEQDMSLLAPLPYTEVVFRSLAAHTHLLLDQPEAADAHIKAAKLALKAWNGDTGILPDFIVRAESELEAHTAQRALLTARERRLLRAFPGPLTLREIGQELGVSLNTIRTHRRNIYKKLGVASRQEALSEARKRGLI